MKVFVDSIGCRLNFSEMETLSRQLLAAGHEIVTDAAEADKIVLNTCAVTSEAAREARQRTRRHHREQSGRQIVLTGCYATIAPDEIAVVDGVTDVVVNKEKDQIARLLDPSIKLDIPIYEQEPILREYHAGTAGHTRAFIKVQDGCDNKCTFCVTTVARGEGVSRHLGDIVAEVQAYTAAGYKEVVLSGVHLGSYGRDLDRPDGLKQLLLTLLERTEMPRIRLSSLEPWEIADGFFDLWENPRLLPHFHLPLQSGSDTVLRRMARRTRQVDFKALVDEARAAIPNLNITTDVIVGFPGETDAEFEDSLNYVREIGFSRLHVFPYSIRPGTAAATMPNHVDKQTKKARMRRMLDLGEALNTAFSSQLIGSELNVLWEGVVGADENGLKWAGYSDNYVRVYAYGPAELNNQLTPVRITSLSGQDLVGEIIEPASVSH